MSVTSSIVSADQEFVTSDGYCVTYRRHHPPGRPRAYVVVLPGIQSHSGWYEWSSRRLAGAGCDVRLFDRRGSGRNQEDRGHAVSAERLLGDVLEVLTATVEERDTSAPTAPVVLTGISWGGKLAVAAAERIPGLIDGLALVTPAIRSTIEPTWWQRLAIRAACRCGAGRKMVPVPLDDPRLFTDDPHWRAFVGADPLALHRVSLSFLHATLELTHRAESAVRGVDRPVFLAVAGRDEIADLRATRTWGAMLPAETTRIIEYPTARHTLEFDPCRDQFVADLLDWIDCVSVTSST